MRRKQRLVALLAVIGVAVGVTAAITAAANDAGGLTLAEQIDAQTAETAAAMKAAENVWAPRVGGLGIGLAVGTLGGGLLAYVNRGDGK